jgi:hypothetical protein
MNGCPPTTLTRDLAAVARNRHLRTAYGEFLTIACNVQS